ncbi:poly(A) polymerase [Kitasatospora viridis]|uniref:Endonuclease/exonuclease/phosphatase family protein n=1 Tax=Kitasatospora viridis TaxID=281105 RepID=A0A561UN52_9ACTN|nr:poly(A) polymerase [Kitasatospora viridis]TWG00789.1 endonuclease/exonuclease/phosphatase family protein [Kitasatospora viridis]
MRTSEEIYHRVRWDARFDPARFVLGVSRRQAEPKRIPLPAFVPGGEIPWHRVLFVEADGELVWDRASGLDLLDRTDAGLAREPRRLQPPFFTPRQVWHWNGAAWTAGAEADGVADVAHPRLVTWNTLWDRYDGALIDTARRRPALLAALAGADADLIALQEVEPALLDLLLAEPWVRERYALSCGPADRRTLDAHGLLLLSRLPVREAGHHELGPHKALAALTVSTAAGPLVLAATHLSSDHSPAGADRREVELARIAEGLSGVPGELVLLGDFNDGREGSAGPGVALALRDAWTEAHGPGDRTPTFDPVANPLAAVSSLTGRAGRLDRILLRPGAARVTGARLLGRVAEPGRPLPSDHYGVAADLDLSGDAPGEVLDLAPGARTAVAWLPPAELWPAVQEVRRRHDAQLHRWPPHVNLLFGFVPEAEFERAAPLLAAAAAEVGPFTARLAGLHSFGHREDATVWLDPAAGGEQPWADLRHALLRRFPRCRGRAEGFTPHLTLGRTADPQALIARATEALAPMTAEVGELVLLSRRGSGPMRPRATVRLGSGELRWLPEALGCHPPTGGPADQALVSELISRVVRHAEVLEVVGSRRMRCALEGADLDLVAIVPGDVDLTDFQLPEDIEVREVTGARVPGLRLRTNGLTADLVVVGCGDLPPAEAVARRAELGEAAAVALSAVTDAAAIERAVGARHAAFALLARQVKAWARARGLDGAPFGGLPGLAWAVLAARTTLDHPELAGDALLREFFADWAGWDWRRPVALLGGPTVSVEPSGHPVTVLTPTAPVRSCTEQVDVGRLDLLVQELYTAWESIGDDVPWRELLASPPLHRRHRAWATVDITAATPERLADTLGRVRGRLRALLTALAQAGSPDLHAWPRPHELTPTTAHFAIGLGRTPPDRDRLAELTAPWLRGLAGVSVARLGGGDVPTLR